MAMMMMMVPQPLKAFEPQDGGKVAIGVECLERRREGGKMINIWAV